MKIIIAGAYAIGSYLAQLLTRNNYDITLLDDVSENLDKLGRDFDLLTIEASPTSIKALKMAGVQQTDLFIAVTPNEDTNITACSLAKTLGAKRTVAKVDKYEYVDPENTRVFKEMGIDSVIYPEMLAAKDIINGLKMSWVRQNCGTPQRPAIND